MVSAGLSAGTWANKHKQIRDYVNFTINHNADPLQPSTYIILSYALYLSDRFRSPGTVLNYLSGARTWVGALQGNAQSFDAYSVALIKRGIQRSSGHVPARALPVTPAHVSGLVSFLRSVGRNGLVLTAALLVGYRTLLRQSNLLLSPSAALARHAIRVRDVHRTTSGLQIDVRSTKTRWRRDDAFTIVVPHGEDVRCCAVAAWDGYVRELRPSPDDPAFILAPGRPLRAPALLAVLRLGLRHQGVASANAYTLHSLRRGGAQACAAAGASLDAIKDLGSWTSAAVFAYVPRAMIQAPTSTLSTSFA